VKTRGAGSQRTRMVTKAVETPGSDYPKPNGAGIRDYIHVVDLALGHVRTTAKLKRIDLMRFHAVSSYERSASNLIVEAP
jgi:UDP-glucose 4-epimerase